MRQKVYCSRSIGKLFTNDVTSLKKKNNTVFHIKLQIYCLSHIENQINMIIVYFYQGRRGDAEELATQSSSHEEKS